MTAAMGLRVGLDLVDTRDIERALDDHGQRYLARTYTERELLDAGGEEVTRVRSLAARFAAKEAALKVLRPNDESIPWTDIEVCREPGGAPRIQLHGRAAELATSRGVTTIEISLSHEKNIAAAVAVALTTED